MSKKLDVMGKLQGLKSKFRKASDKDASANLQESDAHDEQQPSSELNLSEAEKLSSQMISTDQSMEGDDSSPQISIDDNEQSDLDDLTTVRKKQILAVVCCVGVLGVSYLAGSALFGGNDPVKGKTQTQVSNKIKQSNSNLGNDMPTDYSSISAYSQKSKGKAGAKNPAQPNGKQASSHANNTAGANNAGLSDSQYDALAPKPLPSLNQNASGNAGSGSGGSRSYYDESAKKEHEAALKAQAAFEKEQNTAFTSAIAFSNLVSKNANGGSSTAKETSLVSKGTADAPFFESDAGGNTYVLRTGSVLQATLLTGINSDLGNTDVVAQISANVYDSETGDYLLIPQGSRLIGKAGSVGGTGVGVTFSRLVFPDGSGIDLPNVGAIDGTGIPGLRDQYSSHESTFLRGALFSALLGYAADKVSDDSGSTTSSGWGGTTTTYNDALSSAVDKITDRWIDRADSQASRAATVTIRPGTQFAVYINADLSIPSYEE